MHIPWPRISSLSYILNRKAWVCVPKVMIRIFIAILFMIDPRLETEMSIYIGIEKGSMVWHIKNGTATHHWALDLRSISMQHQREGNVGEQSASLCVDKH